MFRYACLHLLKTNDDEYYIFSVIFWRMLHVSLFTYLMRFSKQTWRHTLQKSSFTVLFIPWLIHTFPLKTLIPHKTSLNFSSFLRTNFFNSYWWTKDWSARWNWNNGSFVCYIVKGRKNKGVLKFPTLSNGGKCRDSSLLSDSVILWCVPTFASRGL
jgi:hypothetical protein